MPYLDLGQTRFELKESATTIGAGSVAQVQVPGLPREGVYAVVLLAPGPLATIHGSRGGKGVLINGSALGSEALPLRHGDKIEIHDATIIYGVEALEGGTDSAPALPALLNGVGAASRAAGTFASLGRLVSPSDGTEHAIPAAGARIGRDPACDIVFPLKQVSRLHATISLTARGYMLTDSSANGVWVNGARVQGSTLLCDGDAVRIGSLEFVFVTSGMKFEEEAAPQGTRSRAAGT